MLLFTQNESDTTFQVELSLQKSQNKLVPRDDEQVENSFSRLSPPVALRGRLKTGGPWLLLIGYGLLLL